MSTAPTHRANALAFGVALFGAPAAFGGIVWLMFQGSDYLGRFAAVGGAGLLLSLPVWFTVFAWLAWRSARRGHTEVKHFVFASLGANIASLVVWPALIGLMVLTGLYGEAVTLDLSTLAQGLPEGVDEEPPTPGEAMVGAAAVAFFMGLFFLPCLGALFGAIGRPLGLARPQ